MASQPHQRVVLVDGQAGELQVRRRISSYRSARRSCHSSARVAVVVADAVHSSTR